MTTRTVQGTIKTIAEKQWFDHQQGAEITLYSFSLNEERGWFRTGRSRPRANVGDAVRFVVDTTKGNVEMETLEILGAGTATTAPSVTRSSAPTGNRGGTRTSAAERENYWQEKDRYYKEEEVPRMTHLACLERAIKVVEVGLANEAINLGSVKGKRWENLLNVVDEVCAEFKRQLNGDEPVPAQEPEEQPEDDDGWGD